MYFIDLSFTVVGLLSLYRRLVEGKIDNKHLCSTFSAMNSFFHDQ